MGQHLNLLFDHYPELRPLGADIEKAVSAIVRMHRDGGKLLICGNGGSSSDAGHISGELLKGFLLKRPMPEAVRKCFSPDYDVSRYLDCFQGGVCTIPLPEMSALLSAYGNDVEPAMQYAQLVYAMGKKNDVFWGISTSGNSKNVVLAAESAKSLGLVTIGMTGEKDSKLSGLCDIVLRVPAAETYRIQEYHLPVYHCICAEVESALFG